MGLIIEGPLLECVGVFIMVHADKVNQAGATVQNRLIPALVKSASAAGNQINRHTQFGCLGPHYRSKQMNGRTISR